MIPSETRASLCSKVTHHTSLGQPFDWSNGVQEHGNHVSCWNMQVLRQPKSASPNRSFYPQIAMQLLESSVPPVSSSLTKAMPTHTLKYGKSNKNTFATVFNRNKYCQDVHVNTIKYLNTGMSSTEWLMAIIWRRGRPWQGVLILRQIEECDVHCLWHGDLKPRAHSASQSASVPGNDNIQLFGCEKLLDDRRHALIYE